MAKLEIVYLNVVSILDFFVSIHFLVFLFVCLFQLASILYIVRLFYQRSNALLWLATELCFNPSIIVSRSQVQNQSLVAYKKPEPWIEFFMRTLLKQGTETNQLKSFTKPFHKVLMLSDTKKNVWDRIVSGQHIGGGWPVDEPVLLLSLHLH